MTNRFDDVAKGLWNRAKEAKGLGPTVASREAITQALRAERNATLDEVETLILNRSHKGAWNTTDSGGLTKAVKGLRV